MSTHYDVLGVPRDATLNEIKKAYREMQLKHHPDRTKNLPQDKRKEYEAISKAVNVAYEILSDDLARRQYDKTLPSIPYIPSQPAQAPKPRVPRSRPPPPPPPPMNTHQSRPDSFTSHPPNSVTESDKISMGHALGWKWKLTVDGRFAPRNWPPRVNRCEDSVIISMGLKEQTPTGKPDVHLVVIQSRGRRPVDKLQSLCKRIVLPDGSLTLEITLARMPIKLRRSFRSLDNLEILKFGWNITTTSHCEPPPGVAAYGTCLTFHRSQKEAEIATEDFIGHWYWDPPTTVLQLDSFFRRFMLRLRDMEEEGECMIEHEGVEMFRRAASGYVSP